MSLWYPSRYPTCLGKNCCKKTPNMWLKEGKPNLNLCACFHTLANVHAPICMQSKKLCKTLIP